MYRRGNKSKIITSLVLVLVLGLSLGFAAFSNTLRITPQAIITPNSATFDIDFSTSSSGVVANDITPSLTGTGLTAEAAEIDNSTNPTVSNLSVNFTKPGQKAVYSFYAYNNGEYLAYLNSVNFINPDGKDAFITCTADDETTQYVSDACAGIKVSIKIVPTDSSIETITTDATKENIQGHSLAKTSAEEIIVTIEYASGSAVADGAFNVDIGDITLVYTTVDGNSGGSVATGKTCTYDGELVQGAEFIDGQYTYMYKQRMEFGTLINIDNEDGWGVILTDKESTEAVTTQLCTTINNKPIVAMSDMFNASKATSIDVSSFDTSNVTSMSAMFLSSASIEILGLTNFDTSNVTDMTSMFQSSQFKTLDLSSFDTGNVTTMTSMFHNSKAETLNLSTFDTKKVISMKNMFYGSSVKEIDLSTFDITNVTNIENMFNSTKATTGYARTNDEAARYNEASVTGIPDTLVFTVK